MRPGKLVMNNNKGFTLVELLFVLMIVGITTLLLLPNMYQTVVKQQTKQFFQVFGSDDLYIQAKSVNATDNYVIFPRKDFYYVLHYDNVVAKRQFPEQLQLVNYTGPIIEYSRNGTIKKPHTYTFRDTS